MSYSFILFYFLLEFLDIGMIYQYDDLINDQQEMDMYICLLLCVCLYSAF